MVDHLSLDGVGGVLVDLVQLLYLVKQRFLGCIVRGAEMLGALEHDVLEIVGQTGVVSGVVLSAAADCDHGLEPRLVFVDGHVDLKTVVHGVDLGLEWVAFDSLILSIA